MAGISTSQHSRIKRAINSLNKIRREVQSENDEHVSWLLNGSDDLNLIIGDSHTDTDAYGERNGGIGIQENIARCYTLECSGGGEL
jgi:hypothetical protein